MAELGIEIEIVDKKIRDTYRDEVGVVQVVDIIYKAPDGMEGKVTLDTEGLTEKKVQEAIREQLRPLVAKKLKL